MSARDVSGRPGAPPAGLGCAGIDACRGAALALVPVRANGQLAFGGYLWNDETGAFVAHSIEVLTLRGALIEEVTAFLSLDAVRHFGLPDAIPT